MIRRIALCLLASALLLPFAASAESFAGIELGMDSSADQITAFETYLADLDATGDRLLVRVAASARDAVAAVHAQDVEAFLAAKVVHDYRHQTLGDAQRTLLSAVRAQHEPVFANALGDAPQKVNVYHGCGAQLQCDNGSTISCTCGNPYGNCYYNPNSNSWGGKVDCDCAGTTYDVVKQCPYVPSTSCSPGCRTECGVTGGQCSNGVCYCY